ncbi:MAG TPA: apolipoprotein N-acyltransferase [Acidimicrobiales bacterium]
MAVPADVTTEAPAGSRRGALAGGAASLGAGLLVAASLPPWGWWPLAFVGIALLDRLVAGMPRATRFLRAWLFGVGWLGAGMAWMWFLSIPGYIAATLLLAALHGLAAMASPPDRGRRLVLPAALTLAEAVRFSFFFGGVPLASLAISQAAGPLPTIGRLGGPLLVTWAVLALGAALSALTERAWRPAAALAGGVVVAFAVASLTPAGTSGGTLRVAFVQGGGPQGTKAINSDSREVVERHLEATRLLEPGMDLVVWPENVVDVAEFEGSREHAEITAEARRLNAPFAVGITEDTTDDHFVNAQVIVETDGTVSSRYVKVKRVPFGEYMPFRSLLQALGAPTDLVPRDAVPGTGPAILQGPKGRLGVAISWEIFFGGRGRDGIGHGGRVLLNPTNGSSYTGTILQTQQVASSKLRARETGRWVVQVSPTGFSAYVTPGGKVLDRTSVSEQAVAVRDVELRDGRTVYVRVGERPAITLAGAAVASGWWLVLAARRRLSAGAGEGLTPPEAR